MSTQLRGRIDAPQNDPDDAFERVTIDIRIDGELFRNCELSFAKVVVKEDPRFFRTAEVEILVGDASKARATLGWHPCRTFPELVAEMMQHDLELAGPAR